MNIFYVHALAVVNLVPRVSQMSVIGEREGGTISNGVEVEEGDGFSTGGYPFFLFRLSFSKSF